MAQKSKTQRAKASAARQARKEQKAAEEAAALAKAAEPVEEQPKKKGLKALIKPKSDESKNVQQAQQKQEKKKVEKAPAKKSRFQFLKDVRSELKRVTWPSRQDVMRWSLVVVAALVFFGVFVAVLDNIVITPILVFVSGLGM